MEVRVVRRTARGGAKVSMKSIDHPRRKLNRHARLTVSERAMVDEAVRRYMPLVRGCVARLPDWIRRRHRDEAESLLLTDVMWSVLEYDAEKCNGGGSLEGYVGYRLQYMRRTLTTKFGVENKQAARVLRLDACPEPAGRRDEAREADDREQVEGILVRERGASTGRVGPVLRDRYLMGMSLSEIARRRGCTKERVRQVVDREITRERTR